jgi:hypothetical protein
MQQHVAALQAELKAAQAAADLEATEKEFMAFIDNGQHHTAAVSITTHHLQHTPCLLATHTVSLHRFIQPQT